MSGIHDVATAEYRTLGADELPDASEDEGVGFTGLFRTFTRLSEEVMGEPDWLVRGYLAKGMITELDGGQKVGKTTFYGWLLRAIVEGVAFLGEETRRCRVVLLTEEGEVTLRACFVERCGIVTEAVEYLCLHTIQRYGWKERMGGAVAHARAVGAELIIVDTLARWADLKGDEENLSGPANEAMKPIEMAAHEEGLAVLVVRHDRKSGGGVGESARGSGAFGGAVDIIVHLGEALANGHPTARWLNRKGRPFQVDPPAVLIELVDGEGYRILGSADEMAKVELRRRVLDTLPGEGGAYMTRVELSGELPDVPQQTLGRVLGDLVNGGKVERHGGLGPKARTYGYRTLVEGKKLVG